MRGWFLALAFGAVAVAGCRSTGDWNPFVDLSSYETVVVADFEDGGLGIGASMADQLASELVRRGVFERVLRERSEERAIVVEGQIRSYREGNVAARIKFGGGVGQARLSMTVRLSAEPGGELVGEFEIDETTRLAGPDARRTGREDADWLRQEVVRQIADRLERAKERDG